MAQPPDRTVRRRPGFPVDARLTLRSLRRAFHEPNHRTGPDGTVWRTALTGSGPVTYRVRQRRPDDLHLDLRGPGAAELADSVRREPGGDDRPELFRPRHPVLRRAAHRLPGLRVPYTGCLFEALVPAVLEQRVVGLDAATSFARLVRIYGQPPPGPAPAGIRLPPAPETWRTVPSWEWRRAGVDLHRSATSWPPPATRTSSTGRPTTRRAPTRCPRTCPAWGCGPPPRSATAPSATRTPSRSATTTSAP
ncbi:hypothetical protein [Streptomyces sp. NPDC000983]|uniref:hypothetical protein n=1 Tax=Streptomyces sp. NPDC000983 TaxID=3154373 RepID=UPI0033295437